jgi:hypothetical protein
MATRSLIGIKNSDTSVFYIYCHWDGYPSHHGPILMNHYNNKQIVYELMDLGDLSSLQKNLYCEDNNHSWENPAEGVCVAYGRDRGETDVDYKMVNDVKEYLQKGAGVDHLYLFDPTINKWMIDDINRGVFVELTPEMCK